MTIKAIDYIDNGFSVEDANKLRPIVEKEVEHGPPVILDFTGVQFFTTLFFGQALTYLIGRMGADEYKRRIIVKNLSDSGQATYEHALTYAEEYYAKSDEERREHDLFIDEAMDEL
jgi:hypothetical protein